jgi:hypothetical protein
MDIKLDTETNENNEQLGQNFNSNEFYLISSVLQNQKIKYTTLNFKNTMKNISIKNLTLSKLALEHSNLFNFAFSGI